MKKIFYSLFALAISALTLQSCEDVPAPYDIPGSGEKPSVVEPAGTGTEADPYNIAGILKATESLASGENLPEKVYFKGVVTSVKECSPSYGNATFYLGDDIESTKTFYVYQCLGVGNKNITSEDEVQIGDTITIYGTITNYNGTIETAKKDAYIFKSSRGGASGPVVEGEAKGTGTLEDPYNSVAANKAAAALSSTEQSGVVYIKGKVVSVKEQYSTQYGNASYYISDDGTSAGQFYVFRSLYLGNKKYSSGDLLKEGDEVIVCGKLMNYMGNTPETVQNDSYLFSLNGKTEGGGGSADAGTPKGSGTQADPFNVAGIIKYTSALAADEQSADKVYFKGIVSNAKDISPTYKNATFYISEDGSSNNEFYVFRAKGLDGADITSADDVRNGDEVVICGKVVNYKGNTPETVQGEAYIVSIKHNSSGGGTGGGSDTPDAGSLLSNGGFESWSGSQPDNWKTASSAGNATLSQSTDARSGSYSVSMGYAASANKRMGYKETELEAGTYVFSFYAKATTGGNCQTRPGYVPVKDGSVGTYVYANGYTNLTNSSWTQVTYEFELKEKSTICLVIMNPKASGYHDSQNILIDDAKLVKK